jgi:hypothetical protein
MRPFACCQAIAAALVLSAFATGAGAADLQLRTAFDPDGNVVELNVNSVAVPPSLPGVCTVDAGIGKVWSGTAFHVGQLLTLDVPCDQSRMIQVAARYDAIAPVNAGALRRSRRAIVRLDDEGRIVWQGTLTPYGQWGAVTGYRVLDGQLLPLTRS